MDGNEIMKNNRKISFTICSVVVLLYLVVAIPIHCLIDAFTIRWLIFGLFIPLVLTSFIAIYDFWVNWKAPSEEQKSTLKRNIAKYVCYFWLFDLLYMSIFNGWLVLKYAFGLVLIVIIFCNLITFLLSNKTHAKWVLAFDLLVGVGLSIYLVYIIPDQVLRNVMTSIVSALYGGLLTLVGVAWTIRSAENEKKKDELKKIHPFIYPFNAFNDYDGKHLVTFRFAEDSNKDEKVKYIGMIKNTDNGILVVKKLIIDGVTFHIKYGDILEKNQIAQITLCTSKVLQFNKILLAGEDIRGTIINFNITLNEAQNNIERITEDGNVSN